MFHGDVNARVGANQKRCGWGHQGLGADFIYYDPWRHVALSEEQEKQLLRSARRRISDGHPVGWDQSSIPDEVWAAPIPVDTVEVVPGTG